jgi:hypothetical protein
MDEKQIQRYNWWATKAEKTQQPNLFTDSRMKYNMYADLSVITHACQIISYTVYQI